MISFSSLPGVRHILHIISVYASKRREKKKESERSPEWKALRDSVVAERKECAACGGTVELQAHHILPFHLRPDLELVRSNLLVLCMGPDECHELIGHGGGFHFWNPRVAVHAAQAMAGLTPLIYVVKEARSTRLPISEIHS